MKDKKSRLKNVVFFVSFVAISSLFIKPFVYAALPSSTNYKLNDYSFGSGGATNSSSTNFKVNGVAGEVEFGRPSSINFKEGSGLTFMQTSNVPPAPTITNPSNY